MFEREKMDNNPGQLKSLLFDSAAVISVLWRTRLIERVQTQPSLKSSSFTNYKFVIHVTLMIVCIKLALIVIMRPTISSVSRQHKNLTPNYFYEV